MLSKFFILLLFLNLISFSQENNELYENFIKLENPGIYQLTNREYYYSKEIEVEIWTSDVYNCYQTIPNRKTSGINSHYCSGPSSGAYIKVLIETNQKDFFVKITKNDCFNYGKNSQNYQENCLVSVEFYDENKNTNLILTRAVRESKCDSTPGFILSNKLGKGKILTEINGTKDPYYESFETDSYDQFDDNKGRKCLYDNIKNDWKTIPVIYIHFKEKIPSYEELKPNLENFVINEEEFRKFYTLPIRNVETKTIKFNQPGLYKLKSIDYDNSEFIFVELWGPSCGSCQYKASQYLTTTTQISQYCIGGSSGSYIYAYVNTDGNNFYIKIDESNKDIKFDSKPLDSMSDVGIWKTNINHMESNTHFYNQENNLIAGGSILSNNCGTFVGKIKNIKLNEKSYLINTFNGTLASGEKCTWSSSHNNSEHPKGCSRDCKTKNIINNYYDGEENINGAVYVTWIKNKKNINKK